MTYARCCLHIYSSHKSAGTKNVTPGKVWLATGWRPGERTLRVSYGDFPGCGRAEPYKTGQGDRGGGKWHGRAIGFHPVTLHTGTDDRPCHRREPAPPAPAVARPLAARRGDAGGGRPRPGGTDQEGRDRGRGPGAAPAHQRGGPPLHQLR